MDSTLILVNVVGWTGMLLLVGAYALVTTSILRPTGLLFQVMNMVGGFLLMLNSAYYGAWPSVGLNVVWVVIGAVGIGRSLLLSRAG